MATFAIKTGGKITLRALPSMAVAQRIAEQSGGLAIVDPRSIAR